MNYLYLVIVLASMSSLYGAENSTSTDTHKRMMSPYRPEMVPPRPQTVTEPKIGSPYDEHGNIVRKDYITRYSVMAPADTSRPPEAEKTFADFNFETQRD